MDFELIRAKRKSISLQIREDGSLVVRAPRFLSEREIIKFVESKRDWIEKARDRQQARVQEKGALEPIPVAEVHRLALEAKRLLPGQVAFYAEKLGVRYGRITIRNQTSRWGSCSGKGNLNFNCLLMLTPPEIIDYVVVHELCHLLEMNHSTRFWSHVESILPDYKLRRKWLKQNGSELIERMKLGRKG